MTTKRQVIKTDIMVLVSSELFTNQLPTLNNSLPIFLALSPCCGLDDAEGEGAEALAPAPEWLSPAGVTVVTGVRVWNMAAGSVPTGWAGR